MRRPSEISHRGVITGVNPLKAEIISESACASCHAKGLCSMSDKKRKEITHLVPPQDWEPYIGQPVEIVMRTKMGFKAVWYGMGIPFIVLCITVVVCVLLNAPEWLTGLCALVAMTIIYFVLYLLKDTIRYEFYFTLHNIDA